MCRTKWMMVLFLGLLHSTRFVRGGPTLTIEPKTQWYTATTLTVTCDLAGVTTTGLTFSQGSSVIYTCLFIGLACGHKDGISDYSFVDWSQTPKAIFTISNVTKARDNGVWTCAGDNSVPSSPVTSLSITDADCDDLTIAHGRVTYTNTTYGNTAEYECNDDCYLEGSSTRVCQANGSWSDEPPSCLANSTTSTTTHTTTPSIVETHTSTPIYTIPSTAEVTEIFTKTTLAILGLSEKQRIGLIAGGVGVGVVICCSMCICVKMRRKVNKKKERRRQERRKALEVNAHNSESL